MRFMALSIIFICISLIGIMIGNNFKLRVNEIQEFETIFFSLKNNILFMRTPIAYAIKEACNKNTELTKILKKIADKIDQGEFFNLIDIVKEIFEKEKHRLYLNQDDLNMIYDFFSNLENNNINSFENLFTIFEERLKERLKDAIEVRNKNKKIYSTLGIGIAAMVVIFLI